MHCNTLLDRSFKTFLLRAIVNIVSNFPLITIGAIIGAPPPPQIKGSKKGSLVGFLKV